MSIATTQAFSLLLFFYFYFFSYKIQEWERPSLIPFLLPHVVFPEGKKNYYFKFLTFYIRQGQTRYPGRITSGEDQDASYKNK
jgi:hypothetical protein